MSKIFKKIVSVFKGMEAPKVSTAPVEDLQDDAGKTAKQRRKLIGTEGGEAGEELEVGGVSQRKTLLGN